MRITRVFFCFSVAILFTGPDILTMAEDPIAQIKQRTHNRWWIAVLLAFVGVGALSALTQRVHLRDLQQYNPLVPPAKYP